MPFSSWRARAASVAVAAWSVGAVAQNRIPADRAQFSDRLLPAYSRAQVLNVIGQNFRSETSRKWTWNYVHPLPTEWLRFRIVVRNVPAGVNWRITVFDAVEGGNEIDTLSAGDFVPRAATAAMRSPFQAPNVLAPGPVLEQDTQLVPGARARIELVADGDVGRMTVQIERCNFQYAEPAPKAIVGDDDREDLVTAYGKAHRYFKYSAPIGMILFQRVSDGLDSNCTGFLVAPTLLITNNHCISKEKQLRTALARFGYDQARTAPAADVTFKELLHTDVGLDFTMLRMARSPNVAPARLNVARVTEGHRLILIQHPDRQPKTIAVKNCVVQLPDFIGRKDGVKTDFLHACDSEGGSSGSPIMDESTGEVVGLHHLAFFDSKIMDYHNLGVKMAQILDALKTDKPALLDEITKAQGR